MKKIILIILLIAAGFVGMRITTMPNTISPLPYIIEKSDVSGIQDAKKANVVIVGDRMGNKLGQYSKSLIEKTSGRLKTPLKIYDWSRPHEGLHRTIAKLKQLRPFPPVVIYHGASEELYENKFSIKDREVILKNISRYEDDLLISLILTFPTLSKLIYSPPHFKKLDSKIVKNVLKYPANYKQIQYELSYKIFELELQELITLIKENNSQLILLTTPINLDTPPGEVCENASSEALKKELTRIERVIESGDTKSAFNAIKELYDTTRGNAKVVYLYGQSLKKLGQFRPAKKPLSLASALDCKSWRGNAVYNSIIKQYATKNQIQLIDFDMIVNTDYGYNTTFFDEILPQNLYYLQLVEQLAMSISKILEL